MSGQIPHLIRSAVVFLVLLLVVPAASAGRSGAGASAVPSRARASATTCHQYCGAVRTRVPTPTTPVIVRTEVAPGRGFQWLDAAIGFGVACIAMLLAASAFVVNRRKRVVPAETAG